MQLKITVTNGLREALGKRATHVFDERGGTIGRASHNDWVLPDPKRSIRSLILDGGIPPTVEMHNM